jgi:uncharacterized protein (UPF0335 family)
MSMHAEQRATSRRGAKSDDDPIDLPLAMSKENKEKLREFAKRVEHQETEKKDLSEDINSLNEEIDDAGLDPKLLRKVVKFKQKSKVERDHEQSRFQFYLEVIGDD